MPDVLGHPLRFALRHPRRVRHNRRHVHDSALARRWLDGLRGLEIGGAAHNDFHLDTVDADRFGTHLVIPHRDRTFDRDRPLTPLTELVARHARGFRSPEDRHWSVWTLESFLPLCDHLALPVLDALDPDDKAGNGFMVVLDAATVGAATRSA